MHNNNNEPETAWRRLKDDAARGDRAAINTLQQLDKRKKEYKEVFQKMKDLARKLQFEEVTIDGVYYYHETHMNDRSECYPIYYRSDKKPNGKLLTTDNICLTTPLLTYLQSLTTTTEGYATNQPTTSRLSSPSSGSLPLLLRVTVRLASLRQQRFLYQ